MKTVKDYYRKRFPEEELKNKNALWKVLCENYFQRYVDKNNTVMDIAAGYCEFINNIKAKQKIAVDINPDVKRFANSDIRILNTFALKVPESFNGKIDRIMMSNFLEHLNTKEEVIDTLEKAYRLLDKGGKVMILQPNISLLGNRYWDFIDHKVALNLKSVIEALEIVGFEIETVVERFLPYTTKSILPQSPFFVKIYLSIPSVFRLFAGQSFFVASKK